MSDTLSGLQNALRGGDVLSSIAHPNIVNPLAAYKDALGTASSVYQLRGQQADAAWGNALQQATGPDGTVDIPKAQALAAKDPMARQGMLKALGDTSNLRTQQQEQSIRHQGIIGQAAMSLYADPSDTNVAATRTTLLNSGLPQDEVEREMGVISGLPQPQRQQYALAHGIAAMDAVSRYKSTVPQPATVEQGQTVLHGTITPPGQPGAGGFNPATATPKAPSPDTVFTATPQVILDPRTGAPPNSYTTVPRTAPPVPPTGPAPVSTPPATNQGGAQPPPAFPPVGGAPYTGRGVPQPANPALAGPNKPPPGPQPPPPPATPNTSTPPAPAPAQTTATPPATTPPTPPTQTYLQPPQGQPEAAKADVELFKKDQQSLPQWQTTDQNYGHAYEALKLINTGKSTESTHAMYSWLMAQGALPPGMEDNVKNYDIFKKYTEREVANAGNAAGTDTGRALAQISNPGTSFSTPANLELLRNDIGKNRQQMAAIMLENQQGTGVGYGGRKGGIASTTDPRGFQWDLYSPVEQQKILAEVKNNPAADAKLHRAIGMASTLDLNRTPGQTAPVVPPARPVWRPPGPQAMLQQPNALAAYA